MEKVQSVVRGPAGGHSTVQRRPAMGSELQGGRRGAPPSTGTGLVHLDQGGARQHGGVGNHATAHAGNAAGLHTGVA